MNNITNTIREYNSRLVPFALVGLLIIIVLELVYHIEDQNILFYIHLADYMIIGVFATELYFFWRESENNLQFVKHHWLDILAIFPFGLFIRGVNSVYFAVIEAERLAIGQAIVHESVGAARLAKEVALFEELLIRIERIAPRFLRFFSKSTSKQFDK